jgi:shikimate dehydrogenase
VTTGQTRLLGVIGDPVRHSLSPRIHSRFAEQAGLDVAYLAFPVPRGGGAAFLQAAKTLGMLGFNVTMPLKEELYGLADSRAASAQGAVNTVVLRDGLAEGHSTDGAGFLAAMGAAGLKPQGLSAVVVGAGGASRAVTQALAQSGASVAVCARDPGKGFPFAELPERVRGAKLLVNATPLGMREFPGFDDLSFLAALPADALVFDLVYHPVKTQLLESAAARGLRTEGGLAHLVRQAALSFALFTGVTPSEQGIRDVLAEITDFSQKDLPNST